MSGCSSAASDHDFGPFTTTSMNLTTCLSPRHITAGSGWRTPIHLQAAVHLSPQFNTINNAFPCHPKRCRGLPILVACVPLIGRGLLGNYLLDIDGGYRVAILVRIRRNS
jgi:hypothetical protein